MPSNLLKKGVNTISAIAKDSSGNESQESQVYKVTYDNEPPEIEITSPVKGEVKGKIKITATASDNASGEVPNPPRRSR